MNIEACITEILIDHHPLFTPGNHECYCREDFNDGDGHPEDRWAAHAARVLVTELALTEEEFDYFSGKKTRYWRTNLQDGAGTIKETP